MIVINLDCPCPKKGCINHGNCKECSEHHLTSNTLPFCKREHGLFTKIFYRKSYDTLQLLKEAGKI